MNTVVRSVCMVCVCVVFVGIVMLGRHAVRPMYSETRFLLGTICKLTTVGFPQSDAEILFARGFERIEAYEAMLSIYRETSVISNINKFADKRDVAINEEVFDLLSASLRYGDLSGGLFDITVLPLMRVWGFSRMDFVKPSPSAINDVLGHVGYKHVMLSGVPGRYAVRFAREGMSIDLGGIAKGYICDKVTDLFRGAGCHNFMVDIGGTIYAAGLSQRHKPWVLGIRDPRDKTNVVRSLRVSDRAVATSGDYERYFIDEGIRYAHILNPKTGYPVSHTVSVTVVADTAFIADASSTTLFLVSETERKRVFDSLGLYSAIVFSPTAEKGNVSLQEAIFER